MLYQQGDVLIEAINQVPKDAVAVPRQGGRFILAQGEATGHAHAVADDIELFASDGVLYCASPGPGFTVLHEEHHAITVPAGTYRIRQVLEYDHFAEEAREVAD